MSTLAAEKRNERGEWSRLSTPGAAVGHRLIQILEDDLPGPGLLNLRHRHPAG